MGISGLLGALKSIQKTKKLSEFSGQTIGVDAYVWLHKSVFTCATELATGVPTHKYVDYVVHRLRLLRHYNIEPYLVFDGGPLPAKRGTEDSRKRKRDESLALGKALQAQGKTSQAREHFVKCVDVSPQMAYQVIKALKAEGVSYVVAPYEADAQLAFLERAGIIDAILTEDSDLLVFGCRQVLFKFDHVSSTVVSISRDDFGSVTTSANDGNSISLLGWSDIQFRRMAILSGCDYLPSIPGIGLKTASTLLRKWKTVEHVVKMIALEGKKPVPKGYLDSFKLAESCFLHQRVYNPLTHKLVHLTDVDTSVWNDELDLYVGGDMEPQLARCVAEGDVDPETHQEIDDINPSYNPCPRKSLPISAAQTRNQSNLPMKEKGAARKSGGILDFFGPSPIIPASGTAQKRSLTTKSISPRKQKVAVRVGNGSGKRTLADVLDEDITRKKLKLHPRSPQTQSRFFSRPGPAPSPSKHALDLQKTEKENIWQDDDADRTSMVVLGAGVPGDQLIDDIDMVESVEQEVGYMSPASRSDSPDGLSSPIRGGRSDDEDDIAPLSSPVDSRTKIKGLLEQFSCSRSVCARTPRSSNEGKVLVASSPTLIPAARRHHQLLDLDTVFQDEKPLDACSSSGVDSQSTTDPTPPFTPSPLTPEDATGATQTPLWSDGDDDDLSDPEDREARLSAKRQADVANGWKKRFSHRSDPTLRRSSTDSVIRKQPLTLFCSDTNVTPLGRHSLSGLHSLTAKRGREVTANSSRLFAPPR